MGDIADGLRNPLFECYLYGDLLDMVNKQRADGADEIERLREALERKQRPEAETIDGVIAWIKEDADRLAKARTALGEKE